MYTLLSEEFARSSHSLTITPTTTDYQALTPRSYPLPTHTYSLYSMLYTLYFLLYTLSLCILHSLFLYSLLSTLYSHSAYSILSLSPLSLPLPTYVYCTM